LAIPALKRHLGCPVVLTVHGSIFYKTVNKPGLAAIFENSLEKADVIVAVGPNLKDNILEKFPHLNPKLKTIYNFVDTDFFRPKTQNAFPLSKNDPDKPFQILTIANLRHTKGIDTLIDAVKLLDEDMNIQLSIIGRLDDEPDFKNKIIAKIKSLDLNSIKLLGPKNRKEILHWMHKSDGFVLPSRKEAFGISLIEAMASGLPVVSTKSGGPEIILSEGWGYLVEPDSPVQLAEAIKKLTELESFDAEGQHKYIEENFGKKRYINEHTKLYNSLISS
jgi:glycosyltransferase involved in cell wall biosynthesis